MALPIPAKVVGSGDRKIIDEAQLDTRQIPHQTNAAPKEEIMSDTAHLTAQLRDTQNALLDLIKRVGNLEATVRRLESQEGKWNILPHLSPISTNLSNIREMYLLEILRQQGLLDNVDLAAIEEQVRQHLAGDHIPWGAKTKSALHNLEKVKNEIAGDYKYKDETLEEKHGKM